MTTAATSLTLDTPAQTTPNAAFTVTGTYTGSPQSLDYNFGTGWVQATAVTFSAGIFSFTVPGGIAAGTYTPQIRDHYAPTVANTAGTFVVDPWTPTTLSTSPGAMAVFEFNASNPSVAAVASDGTVHGVLNALNTAQSLTAETGTAGNGIVVADNSGADGKRRLLQFHSTKISASNYDPTTNWLGAGGVNGSAGSALVGLANSTNLSSNGAFTTIIALDISKSYTYAAGPIWGSLASPGPLQYAQIRYNGSSGYAGAQIYDSSLMGGSAQSTIAAGWHVMTMVKTGATITYRLDGQQVSTVTLTTTRAFTASDFMIGGGFPPASSTSAGQENGVPPPYIGEFQAYSGTLAGTDLASAEKLAGNSIGLTLSPVVPGASPTIALSAPGTVEEASVGAGVTVTEMITTTNVTGPVYGEVLKASGSVETAYQAISITNGAASWTIHLAQSGDTVRVVNSLTAPTVAATSSPVTITEPAATSLTLDTPAQATPNAAFTVTGTYKGNPQSLDYNFGTGWVQATAVTFSAGIFSFTVPGGIAAGTYTPQIRDHYAPTVANTAGTFVVDPWTPTTLSTSPGAMAVFEFNASNPSVAAVASDGTVHGVLNALNTAQSLTAETGTAGNGIVVADNSGADGKRRLLQFHSTKISASNYDPTTNWLGAGGVNGSAGSALVGLANSTNLSSNGAFTTIIALDISKSYTYAAGPIWGSLASPGPLQYAQIRYNGSSGYAGAQIYDSSLMGGSAQSTIAAGWHVMTMVKTGATITYRLDGQQVSTVTLTTTRAFTASDFMIGGGFPPASSTSAGQENGVPPPYIGEFQAYSGTLAGTDLASAEKLAGNSIGLTLKPVVPAVVASAAATAPSSDTISATAASNAVTSGVASTFLTAAASGNETFNLNAPGSGIVTITGFSIAQGDVLDLKQTLAGTSVRADLSNIGSFVTATATSTGTSLYVDPTGSQGSGILVAQLTGTSATVAQLVAGHSVSLA